MRKLIALAAVLGAVGTVVAFDGGIAGGSSGSTTIHVTLSQISFATLAGQRLSQNAPPPQGAGFVFNGTLKNTAGQVVGHDNVMCVFATPQGENVGELLCTGAFLFDGKGQIVGTAIVPSNQAPGLKFTVPITGGSGLYRSAHGEIHITYVSDQVNDFVFTVT